MKLHSTSLTALFGMLVTATILIAGDHPAEIAEAKLEKATANYARSEKLFLASVARISDEGKRTETLKAFKDRKESWSRLSTADSSLKIAASPLPDTSTSSSLVPYSTEAHYLDLQRAQLSEDTEWIDRNWK